MKNDTPPTPWPGSNPNKANPVERPWREKLGPLGQLSSAVRPFTLDEVLLMFRNLGVDVECGTCMSVAFTGFGAGEHTCQKK